MKIIKNNLSLVALVWYDAVDYQGVATELYAMIHLVRAKACKEHQDFYRYLVREITYCTKNFFYGNQYGTKNEVIGSLDKSAADILKHPFFGDTTQAETACVGGEESSVYAFCHC